jgi:hypothetical protein
MPDSSPRGATPWKAILYSLAGLVILSSILWAVLSGNAFPLLDSTATAGRGCWVCPIGLLSGVASIMGVAAGIRNKTWIAVIFSSIVIVALLALAIYFLNRGLMR